MGCAGPPELLEYDVAADRWLEHGRVPGFADVVPRPRPRRGPARRAPGRRTSRAGRPTCVFDPGSGAWERLPDDPLPEVYDRFAVAVGDDLVLAGSPSAALDDGGVPDTKLLARLDLATGTWTRLPDAPGPGYQLWAAGDGLLLNGHYRPVWLLDPATGRWTRPDRPWTATRASTSTASSTATTRRTSSTRSGRWGATGGRASTTSARATT